MDQAYEMFHEVLVKLFNDIMNIEAKAIITPEFRDITNNDMHVIEAVGIREPRNMSSVAKTLGITVGTLTISINGLVKKGYVHRVRSDADRRVVLVSLTEKGKKAYHHHEKFHEDMIQSLLKDLSEEETKTLVSALTNPAGFFSGLQIDIIKKRDFAIYSFVRNGGISLFAYKTMIFRHSLAHFFELLNQFQIGSGYFQVGFQCFTVRGSNLHCDHRTFCQYAFSGSGGNKFWKFWVVCGKCTPETGEFHHI